MGTKRGMILVMTLLVVSILLILVVAMWTESTMTVNLQQYQQCIALAETGSEGARGWAESLAYAGAVLAASSDTRGVSAGAPALSFSGGSPVAFQSTSVSGTQAYGVAAVAPTYNSSGTQTGTSQTGYFAFILKRGPPTQIFAIGALGNSATAITAVRELHVKILPRTYSQFTYFSDDPNDQIHIVDQSRDRITNRFLSTFCPPPCSGATTIANGNAIPMTFPQLTSFDKIYSAGQMQVALSSNNEITGMMNAEFHINQPDASAVLVNSNTYLPPGGSAGLYDCGPSCPSTKTLGLPNQANLNNVMQTLFTQAKNGGLFLYGLDPGVSSLTSWVPSAGWDPIGGGTTPSNATVNFNSANFPPASCSVGSGDIQVTNNSSSATMSYRFNGSTGSIPPNANVCLPSSNLASPIIYANGNVNVQADPTNGYKGQFTLAGPGKITVTGSLASQSFLANNAANFGTPTPGVFTSSASDVAGLVTPFKINLKPAVAQADGFKVSAIMMQLGVPYTSGALPGNLPSAWLGASPPASLKTESLFTIGYEAIGNPAPCSPCPYNYIYLYGTQINYHRSGGWYSYYSHIFQPFDINLLSTSAPDLPSLSSGYYVASWYEVNRNNGQDLTYSAP